MRHFPLVDFTVRWRPYELMPSSSGGTRTLGKKEAYLSFMGDPQKVAQYFRRLQLEGSQTGIGFEFEGSTSSTLDAHRLAEWALHAHGADAQDRLVEAQFSAYMEKGEPPNSAESQVRAAAAAGLDSADARRVLEDKAAYADETARKLQQAQREAVSGVPCFRIGGREVATGAQSPEYWEHALMRVLNEQHQAGRS